MALCLTLRFDVPPHPTLLTLDSNLPPPKNPHASRAVLVVDGTSCAPSRFRVRMILAHSGVLWDSTRAVLAFMHLLKKKKPPGT